jgi:CBS-domain-containing membrane protein
MMDASMLSAVDQLTEALDLLRPQLDRRISITERAQNLWAITVAVRELAAADVLAEDLTNLAQDTALMEDLRGGAEDVAHLIRWGLLDRNPF